MRGKGVFILGIAAVAAQGCGGAAASNEEENGFAGGSAAGGSGGALNLGGEGGVGAVAGNGGGSGLTGCKKDSYTGELLPVDLFVMLDRSGSMQDSGKWGSVTGALNQFVSLPGLSKLGMGIGFFPTMPAIPPPTACTTDVECGFYGPCLPVFGCAGGVSAQDSCVATDYQKPVVSIADLPGVGSQISGAISGTGPDGMSTPIAPALEGAIDYATVWAPEHPDHVTAVVLATDGEPTNCNPNTVQDAAAHAAEGLAQSPSVKTFVIGVGDLSALNAIAQAGGTDQAILVSAGNAGQEFLDALNKIRGAIGCSYAVPTPPSGVLDPSLVNVGFTPDNQPDPDILKPKKNLFDCMGEGGWYYDNPLKPTQIQLCPASCDLVTHVKGKVDVVLGCPTIPA